MSTERMGRFFGLVSLLMILFSPCSANEEIDRDYLETSFVGTWEGDLNIVSAPSIFINIPETLSYRIEVGSGETTLFIKGESEDWSEGLSGSHVIGNAQVVASLVNAQEGFIEYYAISLIRTAKDTAQAYVLRTVNNFGIDPKNEAHHFSMYSEGFVKRTHNKALQVTAYGGN